MAKTTKDEATKLPASEFDPRRRASGERLKIQVQMENRLNQLQQISADQFDKYIGRELQTLR